MFYNSYQSAAAALEKISGVLEEQPSVPDPAQPGRPVDGAGRASTSTTCASRTATTGSCCPSSTCTSRPGRPSRSSARPAPASRRSPSCSSRFYDPTAGSGAPRRRRPARPAPEGPAPRDRHGHAGGVPVQRLGRREHRARQAGRDARRDPGGRAGGRRRTSSSRRCRTATTPT